MLTRVSVPAPSMPIDLVEVCFPAWPARRAIATSLTAFSERLGAGPVEAAAFIAFALLVPGVIAVLSVAMLAFLVAFVLLAPLALMLLAWACWRHDRRFST